MYTMIFILLILLVSPLNVYADCAPGCVNTWPGDGWCDSACYNAACNWDDGDCTDDNTSGDDVPFTDDIWTGECSISSCPGLHQGHCGAFGQETDKWCEMGGTEVCCAETSDECCEPNGGAIVVTVIGIIVFISLCCYYCCNCNKNNQYNEKEPPHFCFKLFCPPCAVFGYQGCENKSDVCMTCCCCWLFTLCCWEPKQVVVNDTDNTLVNIQSTQGIEVIAIIDKVQHV